MTRVLLALLVLATAACGTPIGQKPSDPRRPTGHVERATFTTAIQNREPQGKVYQLQNDQQKVYYFTELMNMTGQTVTHRWKFEGDVMANVQFQVNGPRWRVYSSKWLETHWLGVWSASVISESGRTLSTSTFSYSRAPRTSTPAAADGSLIERGASSARSFWDSWFGDEE